MILAEPRSKCVCLFKCMPFFIMSIIYCVIYIFSLLINFFLWVFFFIHHVLMKCMAMLSLDTGWFIAVKIIENKQFTSLYTKHQIEGTNEIFKLPSHFREIWRWYFWSLTCPRLVFFDFFVPESKETPGSQTITDKLYLNFLVISFFLSLSLL